MKQLFEWLWCKVGFDTVLGVEERFYWVGVVEETVAGPLFGISDGKVEAEYKLDKVVKFLNF